MLGVVKVLCLELYLISGKKMSPWTVKGLNFALKLIFENQLLPIVNNRSLISMDNAPCHSKILNKVPTTCYKKYHIIHWWESLKLIMILVTKLELFEICKHHKQSQIHEVDQIVVNHGQKVLWLPPYHCIKSKWTHLGSSKDRN